MNVVAGRAPHDASAECARQIGVDRAARIDAQVVLSRRDGHADRVVVRQLVGGIINDGIAGEVGEVEGSAAIRGIRQGVTNDAVMAGQTKRGVCAVDGNSGRNVVHGGAVVELTSCNVLGAAVPQRRQANGHVSGVRGVAIDANFRVGAGISHGQVMLGVDDRECRSRSGNEGGQQGQNENLFHGKASCKLRVFPALFFGNIPHVANGVFSGATSPDRYAGSAQSPVFLLCN